MESVHPEVGREILEKQKLDDEITGKLKDALTEFKDRFANK
jgi:F0F1-type ATP synthase alpha subunit